MKNIYNMDHQGLDEELFTVGIGNLGLHTALPIRLWVHSGYSCPHLGQPASEVACTLAGLGEAEPMRAGRRYSLLLKKAFKGPLKVWRTQVWVDLIKAGVVKEKLDGQPNQILLELW